MPAAHDPLLERITIDPDVLFGKPCTAITAMSQVSVRGRAIDCDPYSVHCPDFGYRRIRLDLR